MEVELLASVVRNCKHKTKQPYSTHLHPELAPPPNVAARLLWVRIPSVRIR